MTGYVQGMSYLAAILLNYLEPEQAFIAFANLLTQHHFPPFYTVHQQGMKQHMLVFDDLLTHCAPHIAGALEAAGVRSDMFLIDWWMTLFSRVLPLPLAIRCWDLFLGHPAHLYRIAVAILLYFEVSLLNGDRSVHSLINKDEYQEAAEQERLDPPAGFCTLEAALRILTCLSRHHINEARFMSIVSDINKIPHVFAVDHLMERHGVREFTKEHCAASYVA